MNDAIREVMAELAAFFSPSTGGVAVSAGGTGAVTAAQARSNLAVAASGANADITSLTGLTTPLAASEGGTGMAGQQSVLSAAQNGYFKTYSGLIIQWGRATLTANNTTAAANIYYPVVFPNACFVVLTTGAAVASGAWTGVATIATGVAANGFTGQADTCEPGQPISANYPIYWLAIGN